MTDDINSLCHWFWRKWTDYINVTMGKTETMLFGTSKRMNLRGRELNMFVKGTCINCTFSYKYPGIDLDPNRTLGDILIKLTREQQEELIVWNQFVRLLIKNALKESTTLWFYQFIFTYCESLGLVWSDTLKSLVNNVEQRSVGIIGNSSLKHPSVENTIKCKSGQLVFDCFLDNLCSPFKSYFERLDHFKSTRKDGFSVKLPEVCLEFGKKGFYYQGA